jgi:23S rRNA pseudouridine2605 synthase
MIRERGQERRSIRTVENRVTGKRPRIKKEGNSEGASGTIKRTFRTGVILDAPTGTGRRIGKSRPESNEKGASIRKTVPKRILKEKTSDIFRRNVINKPSKKRFEGAETDTILNANGNVIRGRLGKRNLYTESGPGKKSTLSKPKKDDGTVRLNRFIANAGMCSRREADTYIATGCVTVNGKIISEMGYKVNPGDQVSFNGKIITTEKKVYLLLNKPKGFVTTVEDPHADKTVMDLVKNACYERIYPVGRLDKSTTGLLLFTNDGDMTKRLTHPKYNRKKIYHVQLDQKVTKAHLEQIVDGITLEDGFVAADSISYVDLEDKKQVGIEIHSGKNKIVRRLFEHLGYKVMKLDRVYFCGLTKKNLPRGNWRFLTQDEVNMLKMTSH